MKVTTGKPLDWIELLNITHKDALMVINGYKCRYLMTTEGQEVEADFTQYDEILKLKFGLKKASKPGSYDYVAFIVE